MLRDDRMIDPFEIVTVDVLLRAERPLVEGALGALVGDRALRPVEGRAVGFALQEVLPDLRPDFLQPEANMGEDRIVAADAVTRLDQVPDADGAQRHARDGQQREDDVIGGQHRKNDGTNGADGQCDESHGHSPALTAMLAARSVLRALFKTAPRGYGWRMTIPCHRGRSVVRAAQHALPRCPGARIWTGDAVCD